MAKVVCTYQCEAHSEHVFSETIEEGSLQDKMGAVACKKCDDYPPAMAKCVERRQG